MTPKSKIYTKTGDKGTTRLVDGSCVEKFNPRVEAYGTVDELNSILGEVRNRMSADSWTDLDSFFERLQNHLFNVGSLLACPNPETAKTLPPIDEAHISELEHKIDELDATLPSLKNFILPAGHSACTALHMARSVCRRAERRTAEIESTLEHDARCLIYLNRLSDFLFVAARWVNARTGRGDVAWTKS